MSACWRCIKVYSENYDLSEVELIDYPDGWKYCTNCDRWVRADGELLDAANFDPFEQERPPENP